MFEKKGVVGRDVFEKERALWEGMSLKKKDIVGNSAVKGMSVAGRGGLERLEGCGKQCC